jgi:hypothetical protein
VDCGLGSLRHCAGICFAFGITIFRETGVIVAPLSL